MTKDEADFTIPYANFKGIRCRNCAYSEYEHDGYVMVCRKLDKAENVIIPEGTCNLAKPAVEANNALTDHFRDSTK